MPFTVALLLTGFIPVGVAWPIEPALQFVDRQVEPQNDAGSGGDAPGTREAGLSIGFGTHQGRLQTVPGTTRGADLPDAEDWYLIQVEAGTRISVVLRGVEPSPEDVWGPILHYPRFEGEPTNYYTYDVLLEVRTPSGRLATWAYAKYSWETDSAWTLADESGTWGIRLATYETGGRYEFSVDARPASLHHAVKQGPGYLTFGFEREGEGGGISFDIDLRFQMEKERPWRVQILIQGPDGRPTSIAYYGNGIDHAGSHVGPLTVDAYGPDFPNGYWLSGLVGGLSDFGPPGRYDLVVLLEADDAYVSIEVAKLPDNMRPVNWTRAGREGMRLLRHADFTGDLRATLGPIRVSQNLSAPIDVSGSLIGWYECGEWGNRCSYTRPNGTHHVMKFPGVYLKRWEAGHWVFHRDSEWGDPTRVPDPYLLFACDCRLAS